MAAYSLGANGRYRRSVHKTLAEIARVKEERMLNMTKTLCPVCGIGYVSNQMADSVRAKHYTQADVDTALRALQDALQAQRELWSLAELDLLRAVSAALAQATARADAATETAA